MNHGYIATIRCLCGEEVSHVGIKKVICKRCGTALRLEYDGLDLTPYATIEQDTIPNWMPYKEPEILAYMNKNDV